MKIYSDDRKELSSGLIISGFAGIGKSTLARDHKIVDLESTPFANNWELYSDVAEHMRKNGYIVAVAAHADMRRMMQNKNIPYAYVIPSQDSKDDYLSNYGNRGNHQEFIQFMGNMWDSFRSTLDDERVYELRKGQYLTDILSDLIANYKSV